MLVISDAPGAEAERLSAQAIGINERILSPEQLKQVTSIDGAALFAPDGTCHALGVILDGVASAQGDRSRGARYNSALRYLSSARAATMIVLVSEDGMIDVLPRLRPQIARDTVDAAVDTYRRLTTADDVDGELRYDAFQRLEELAFYLSSSQCELVNSLESSYQDRQLAQGGFKISQPLFEPHPDMNDSFFSERPRS
jgi:hypothetical protein